ncbi:hypothetical protein SUGI_1151280 [Cryptomeria japonica]|nr:hypothetical protein SUGI_1151280 [Cryptomeria japonica]
MVDVVSGLCNLFADLYMCIVGRLAMGIIQLSTEKRRCEKGMEYIEDEKVEDIVAAVKFEVYAKVERCEEEEVSAEIVCPLSLKDIMVDVEDCDEEEEMPSIEEELIKISYFLNTIYDNLCADSAAVSK